MPTEIESRTKKVFLTLATLVASGVIYVANFGLYPRYFDIGWDEEVLSGDERVVLVHVVRTFERRGLRLSRYEEEGSTMRRNTFVFKPSVDAPSISFSTRMPVAYLGEIRGTWYAVVAGQGPYGNFPDEMPDYWGRDFTTLEQRLAVLKEGKFQPVKWEEAPRELVRMNLLPSIPLRDLVALKGRKVTLAEKHRFEEAHPTPRRREIARPLRMANTKGETN